MNQWQKMMDKQMALQDAIAIIPTRDRPYLPLLAKDLLSSADHLTELAQGLIAEAMGVVEREGGVLK